MKLNPRQAELLRDCARLWEQTGTCPAILCVVCIGVLQSIHRKKIDVLEIDINWLLLMLGVTAAYIESECHSRRDT